MARLPRRKTLASIKTYLESLTPREVEMVRVDAYTNVPRSALSGADALVYGAAAWFLGYQTPDEDLIGDLGMDDENGGGELLPVGGYDVIRAWTKTLRKPAAKKPAAKKPAAKKPAAKKPAAKKPAAKKPAAKKPAAKKSAAKKPAAKKPAAKKPAAKKPAAPKEFGVGDIIMFGAPTGEHTRARIVRVNERTYTVTTLEGRGKANKVGQTWRVGKAGVFAEGDASIGDPRRTRGRRRGGRRFIEGVGWVHPRWGEDAG